jgi:PilZ domain
MVDHTRQALGERRRHRRVTLRLEVAYEDPDRQVFLPTRDLSEGGCYLADSDPPPAGCQARVTLELPGGSPLVRCGGTVVRRDAAGFALRFDERPSEAAREALRAFLTRVPSL